LNSQIFGSIWEGPTGKHDDSGLGLLGLDRIFGGGGAATGMGQVAPGIPASAPTPNITSADLSPLTNLVQSIGAPAPSDRLDSLINGAKVKRSIKDSIKDLSSMDLIRANLAASETRTRAISDQLAQLQMSLQAPPPMKPQTQMSPSELLASGLAMALGARPDQAIASGMGVAQNRQDIDYANQMQAYQVNRENNLMMSRFLQSQLADETNNTQRLGLTQIDAQRDLENRAMQAENQQQARAENRFYTATTEAEVLQAAEEMKRLGVPVSDEVIQMQANAAKDRRRQLGLDMYRRTVTDLISMYGGVPQDKVDELDAQVQKISREYGIDLPPIMGGPTWKAKRAEEDLKFKKAEADRNYNLKKERYKFLGEAELRRLADREAEYRLSVKRLNAQIQQGAFRSDYELGRQFYSQAVRPLEDDAKSLRKELFKLRSETKQLKAEIDAKAAQPDSNWGPGSIGKTNKAKEIADMQAKYSAKAGAISDYESEIKDIEAKLAQARSAQPSQATPAQSGGTRILKTRSGKTITVTEGG
jgi:hypothetical protein